jgi:MATE family multidrug resistance protein
MSVSTTAPHSCDRESLCELLPLAWPLILSNSLWTVQITLNRAMLSRYDAISAGAQMSAALLFWSPFALPYQTAGYATTFVAQYLGAGQRQRVGAAVWQALWFALLAGFAFLALLPAVPWVVALGGHEPALQEREIIALRCQCWAALPLLVLAAAEGFFAGCGDSRTVLLLTGLDVAVNAVCNYAWIFGHWGFPEMGIAGAGWATVAGNSVSAILAVALLLRRTHREEFGTLSQWRFDGSLFRRLLRYGLPSGIFLAMDTLAYALFSVFVGRIGAVELTATTMAFTLNLLAYLPAMGIGQAVGVLVGQHLGRDDPERAERSAWTGLPRSPEPPRSGTRCGCWYPSCCASSWSTACSTRSTW